MVHWIYILIKCINTHTHMQQDIRGNISTSAFPFSMYLQTSYNVVAFNSPLSSEKKNTTCIDGNDYMNIEQPCHVNKLLKLMNWPFVIPRFLKSLKHLDKYKEKTEVKAETLTDLLQKTSTESPCYFQLSLHSII